MSWKKTCGASFNGTEPGSIQLNNVQYDNCQRKLVGENSGNGVRVGTQSVDNHFLLFLLNIVDVFVVSYFSC